MSFVDEKAGREYIEALRQRAVLATEEKQDAIITANQSKIDLDNKKEEVRLSKSQAENEESAHRFWQRRQHDRIAARQRYASSLNSEFLPTLDELSTRGIFQRDAQRLLFLQRDAHDAALFGHQQGRQLDLREIQDIRTRLSRAGAYEDPNQGVIDEIKKLGEVGMPVVITNED